MGVVGSRTADRRRPSAGSATLTLLVLAAGLLLAACGAPRPGTAAPSASPGAEGEREPSRPHPHFTLTRSELRTMAGTSSPEIAVRIMERPQLFLELSEELLRLPPEVLARADKERALPEDYQPADLIPLERYADRWILNREGLSLRALIIPDLAAMIEAARLDGILLDISSSYRSYAYQQNLFAYWVSELGQEEAERVSARAGTSQHQLGTTVDFGSVTPEFAEHPAGRWLAANAAAWGFSLSYPDGYEHLTGYAFEPWHYRWLSRAGTRMEQEFFGGLQQLMIEFWEEHEAGLRAACTTLEQPATLAP